MTERFDLRAARLNAGMSQRKLAEVTGAPLVTIQSLESGGGGYPANVKRVADYFGVQVTDLMPLNADESRSAA